VGCLHPDSGLDCSDLVAVQQLTHRPVSDLFRWVGEEVFIRLLQRFSPEHAFPEPDRIPSATAGQLHHSQSEALHSIRSPDQPAYRIFKLAPEWPSITAGGARFLHPARAFLVHNWKLLFWVYKRYWLGYYPNRAISILFGHSLEDASKHPRNPVQQPGLIPAPNVPYVPKICPNDAKADSFRMHRNPAGVYASLVEYVVLYPNLGRILVQRIKGDSKLKTNLLGIYKATHQLTELREILKV
jgi:hypothetical protein